MTNKVSIEAWEAYKESKEAQLKKLRKKSKDINDKLTKKVSDEVFKNLMLQQELVGLDILLVETNIKSSQLQLKYYILMDKKTELINNKLDSVNRI